MRRPKVQVTRQLCSVARRPMSAHVHESSGEVRVAQDVSPILTKRLLLARDSQPDWQAGFARLVATNAGGTRDGPVVRAPDGGGNAPK